jgi:fimbrial chaperone protein
MNHSIVNTLLINRFKHMRLLECMGLLCCSLALPANASDFAVSPIRIDLDHSVEMGSTTVKNGDDEALRTQIQLVAWTQDAKGKDQYSKSEDLLYYPKLQLINKSEEAVVRVAARNPATTQEKTYRLFIEELPAPLPKEGLPSARVGIGIRFGVPIFVKPLQEHIAGEISRITMDKGTLHVLVKNTGNAHFAIKSITAISPTDASFSKAIEGWYLLAGVSREYSIPLSADVCRKYKQLELTVKTDTIEFKNAYAINPNQCG